MLIRAFPPVGNKRVSIVIVGVVAVISVAIALHYARPAKPARVPLTPEAKAYVAFLKLGPAQMKAADSYMHQTITEIDGTITNAGNRSIRSIDIDCIFYDAYGQMALRERVAIVKPAAAPFRPGDTRNYRLAFDDIPSAWNNQLPRLVIGQITFD